VSSGVNPKQGRAGAPVLAVLGAASLWGTTGTAQELGPDGSTPLGVGAIRLIVGSLVLAAIAALSGGHRHQPWRSARVPLLVGGVAVAVYQLSFFAATSTAGVAVATVITIGSAPVFSTGITAARGRGWPRPRAAAAVACSVVGVTLLGLDGASGGGENAAAGVLAALAAGAGYALYAELGRVAMDRGMHSTTAMAALFGVGAAIAALALPWQPLGWATTPSGVAMIVHLGVVTLGVGYVLYGWGLRQLPVPTVVTLTLAEPVVASLLALLVLDEVIGAVGWIGIGLVVTGLAAVARAAPPPDETRLVDTVAP
jgi:DME family drug/metabolite transporter